MQIMSGNYYWKEKSKIKNVYPYLTSNLRCDVVIVGGGITGAITAYYLAKEGADVIVVEKNIIGYGETLASSAIIEAQMDLDILKLEKFIGSNHSKKIYKMAYNAIDEIENINDTIGEDLGFERKDLIYFTNKFMQKSQMQREYENRKKLGNELLFLDSHDIIDMQNGILTKGASAVLNPYMFTQSVFEYLNRMPNVRIFENTNIEDIISSYDSVKCITNNNFKILSDSLILTSGMNALRYIGNVPLEVSKTYTVITKPIKNYDELNLNFTARDSSDPHHYIRFTNTGRLIFGGEDTRINDRFYDEKYSNMVANDRYKKLKLSFEKILYGIDKTSIEYASNASICNTKDSLPIVDEIPDMPNCFCNIGFGTNGIIHSVIGANMLKNAIKGFYTKDMNIFKITR